MRVEVGRGCCHSHLRSRENHTDSPSAQQRATAPALAEPGHHQHFTVLHYGPSETVHRGVFSCEHEEFCGPLGAILFTANINDCSRSVPWGFWLFSVSRDPLFLSEIRDIWKNNWSLPAQNSISLKSRLEYLCFLPSLLTAGWKVRGWSHRWAGPRNDAMLVAKTSYPLKTTSKIS